MVLKLMVRVLQHAAVLAAAPAFLHRMYGVEKTGGLLTNIDLRWVNEPYWWTLAAACAVSAAALSWMGARTPREWGGERRDTLTGERAPAASRAELPPAPWVVADAARAPRREHATPVDGERRG